MPGHRYYHRVAARHESIQSARRQSLHQRRRRLSGAAGCAIPMRFRHCFPLPRGCASPIVACAEGILVEMISRECAPPRDAVGGIACDVLSKVGGLILRDVAAQSALLRMRSDLM